MTAPSHDALVALHAVTKETPIAELKASEAFAALTAQEASYAAAIAAASWAGSKITVLQISPESPPLFALLRAVIGDGDVVALRSAALAAGVTDEQFELWAAFAATFIDNLSNYKSFGDTKLIPSIAADVFHTVVTAGPQYAKHAALIDRLWAAVREPLYAVTPSRVLQLGLGPTDGVSTYYSANMTREDVELVGRWVTAQHMVQPYNSRVFKTGAAAFQVRIASEESAAPSDVAAAAALHLGRHEFEGAVIDVVRGDYAPLLARVNAHLREATAYASNDRERAMLEAYVRHFNSGDMSAHVAGSVEWVRNVGPVVECYLGFIESYRDPTGIRGEFEGFVAVVNKATSAKFGELVRNARDFLAALPWGATFEKDEFRTPDFTSLEVLGFAGSGVPAGINIPNYDDVRQEVGFKNVSLGNVLSARDMKERVPFLRDSDQELYKSALAPAFEVQVGLHELLGHGSGKLFVAAADGSGANFDRATIDPTTGAPVASWYKPGETWDGLFGASASTMEECRAEAVGILLCTDARVLRVFGHAEPQEQNEIVYVNWLNMARAGVVALQFYNPSTRAWGQAHMQARFALLRVMLRAGGGLVTITGLDSEPLREGDGGGVTVALDREKIATVGVPAVAAFLHRLQVFKSTANVAALGAEYAALTSVPPEWQALRELVVANRRPRQMFVQPVLERAAAPTSRFGTTVPGAAQADVVLRTFAATPEGMMQAFAARYPETDDAFLALWEAERAHHVL